MNVVKHPTLDMLYVKLQQVEKNNRRLNMSLIEVQRTLDNAGERRSDEILMLLRMIIKKLEVMNSRLT